MNNVGNSCFVAAAVRALCSCDSLLRCPPPPQSTHASQDQSQERRLELRLEQQAELSRTLSLRSALRIIGIPGHAGSRRAFAELVAFARESERGAAVPQDAQEFLMRLLERCWSDTAYGGLLGYRLVCRACGQAPASPAPSAPREDGMRKELFSFLQMPGGSTNVEAVWGGGGPELVDLIEQCVHCGARGEGAGLMSCRVLRRGTSIAVIKTSYPVGGMLRVRVGGFALRAVIQHSGGHYICSTRDARGGWTVHDDGVSMAHTGLAEAPDGTLSFSVISVLVYERVLAKPAIR